MLRLFGITLFWLFTIAFFPALAQSTEKKSKDLSYTTECFYPEFPAEFPGGYEAMFRYFAEKTDQVDLTHKADGLVILQISLTKTGTIEQAALLQGLDPELDSLALIAAKEMPSWIPAKHNGEIVPSSFMLPVRFQKLTAKQKTKTKRKN